MNYRPPTQAEQEYGRGEEYELRIGTPLYDPDVDECVVVWRASCFMSCGYEYADALELALRRDVDRQRLEDLLAAGATHDQARELVL